MKDGATAKFSQNKVLKEYLISTGSRWDTTWGVVVVDFNDPAIDDITVGGTRALRQQKFWILASVASDTLLAEFLRPVDDS